MPLIVSDAIVTLECAHTATSTAPSIFIRDPLYIRVASCGWISNYPHPTTPACRSTTIDRRRPVPYMEEFQEADVLWPDHRRAHDQPQRRESRQPHHVDVARAPRQASSSAPVGIPEVRSFQTAEQGSWARGYCGSDDDGVDSRASSASFVAPHEMAARRRCGEERSVCVGHGRTLKGRDLRSVRTAVLRMTGFVET
uniref:Uncharacterized protein n=1 Tax=Avena sativa TaxID=4498 RepID=A0ACD5U1E0_AVESA